MSYSPTKPSASTRRTRIVWSVFIAAMTLTAGLLMLGDTGAPPMTMAVNPVRIGGSVGPVEPRQAPAAAWKGIVVHGSGTAGGDPELLSRQTGGASFHFIIGNGQGMADGSVHVSPAWDLQEMCRHIRPTAPGGLLRAAHDPATLAKSAERASATTISICLVGNGNRRAFTDLQMQELVTLVRALQDRFAIPADRVLLRSDVDGTASPGQYFRQADFEAQLRR